MVENRGIEPRISACKADVFPLALVPQIGAPERIWTSDHTVIGRVLYQTELQEHKKLPR